MKIFFSEKNFKIFFFRKKLSKTFFFRKKFSERNGGKMFQIQFFCSFFVKIFGVGKEFWRFFGVIFWFQGELSAGLAVFFDRGGLLWLLGGAAAVHLQVPGNGGLRQTATISRNCIGLSAEFAEDIQVWRTKKRAQCRRNRRHYRGTQFEEADLSPSRRHGKNPQHQIFHCRSRLHFPSIRIIQNIKKIEK